MLEASDVGEFYIKKKEFIGFQRLFCIGPVEICSLALGETCGDVANPSHEWSVMFPDKVKPEVMEPPLPQVFVYKLCSLQILIVVLFCSGALLLLKCSIFPIHILILNMRKAVILFVKNHFVVGNIVHQL